MTDTTDTTATGAADRVAALRQRQPAGPPAQSAKILTAGLSASMLFGLMGWMGMAGSDGASRLRRRAVAGPVTHLSRHPSPRWLLFPRSRPRLQAVSAAPLPPVAYSPGTRGDHETVVVKLRDGHTADVIVAGDPALAERGRRMIEHFERCWSRFSAASDVSRLNRANGSARSVDPSTVTLVTAMVNGWRATGGTFDPTEGCGNPDDIRIDATRNLVCLPPGVTLDAGAIGKGLAAHLVADELMRLGAVSVVVDMGGDIAVRGDSTIAVEGSDDVVRLHHGGIATSGAARAWHRRRTSRKRP